jgi:hypothetical protein
VNDLELLAGFRADVSVSPSARRAAGEQLHQLMLADPGPAGAAAAGLVPGVGDVGSGTCSGAPVASRVGVSPCSVGEGGEYRALDLDEVSEEERALVKFIETGWAERDQFQPGSIVFIPSYECFATICKRYRNGMLHVQMHEAIVPVSMKDVVSTSGVAGETLEELIECMLERGDPGRPEAPDMARDALELSSSRGPSRSSAESKELEGSSVDFVNRLGACGVDVSEPEAEALADRLFPVGSHVGVG